MSAPDRVDIPVAAAGGRVPRGARARLLTRRPAMLTPASVHGASLAIGAVVLLVFGRGIWFAGDDFDFLAQRGFHHADLGIFVPHNEHWSTIPILLWRAVYAVVGLRHYGPYLALMIIAHLVAVHLLWRIARQLSIDPWVATSLACSAVLLGVGWENLLWAFQVGFVGSVAFGLGAVLGSLRLRSGWRQGSALLGVWALSIGGLMCSGIGVSMVIGTALTAWVARGLRPAVMSAALPTLVYAAWYEAYGKAAVSGESYGLSTKNVDQLPAFVANGFTTALAGWVNIPDAGATLLIVTVIIAASRRLRGVTGLPLALVATGLIFFAITATGRIGFGVAQAGSSRYSYIIMMLLFPTIMVGFDLLARQSGLVVTVVVSGLLVLSGLSILDTQRTMRVSITQANKENVLAAAFLLHEHQPLIGVVPQGQGIHLTTTVLSHLAVDGNVPGPASVTPTELEGTRAGLQLTVSSKRVVRDLTPAIVSLNGAVVAGRTAGCVSLKPLVPNSTVTVQVTAAISAFAIAVGQPATLTGTLNQVGQSAPGVFAMSLTAHTNWFRDADAGSVLTVILPSGLVSTFCHVTGPA